MTLSELVEYNLKLYLIKNAGLVYMYKTGSRLLETLTSDPILIKMHRRLHKKYGSIVLTYIITKSRNYYILDPSLAKSILKDSPYLFSAGDIKEEFFKSVMPYNLGISKCTSKQSCPWKKRRVFNEEVLGTNSINPFFYCIPDIISKNITKPLLNIKDFKEAAFKIVSDTVYGKDGKNVDILKQFIPEVNKTSDLTKTPFYKEYLQQLSKDYRDPPRCSLLHYAKLYQNSSWEVTKDQVPHWFAPLTFIISFLIPNLLCVLLNFKNVYSRVREEISKKEFDIFSKSTYLHYCVVEHIRLFNTININIQRTVDKDMLYHGFQFKKGDQLFLLFSSILRNEKEFNNPDEYRPSRWENRTEKEQDIVFGVGPQQCPSRQISPIYYKVVLLDLLRNYEYKEAKPILNDRNLYFIDPYQISFSIK